MVFAVRSGDEVDASVDEEENGEGLFPTPTSGVFPVQALPARASSSRGIFQSGAGRPVEVRDDGRRQKSRRRDGQGLGGCRSMPYLA